MRILIATCLILISLATLEFARKGVTISRVDVGHTPVTSYAVQNAEGPVVVIAHGFAGSQQMMQGYALPLARAGYRVFAFDFLGHGRHTLPMSGDVTTVDGTTGLLVAQTNAVLNAVAADTPSALIGHSMATDVLVRTAQDRSDIGPIVLISAFSQAIDATSPQDLLLISGAWEGRLRSFGTEMLQMVQSDAAEGTTATNGPATNPVTRRAVSAPFSEHVSILQSRTARAETLAWLDRAYDRNSDQRILPTGWAILGLLFGLVLLICGLARRLPAKLHPHADLNLPRLVILLLAPALITPVLAVPLNPNILPVLVADYLGLHLFLFGIIQLLLLRLWGVHPGRISWPSLGLLLLGCFLFGLALDRYAANFLPTLPRLWIIAILLLGTLPYMIADAILTHAAPLWQRFVIRLSLLLSLGLAVALDFEGLFFLMIIAPVLVLFYLVFGTMGRAASTRAGPLASGVALSLVLAWALGVSFPLFQT